MVFVCTRHTLIRCNAFDLQYFRSTALGIFHKHERFNLLVFSYKKKGGPKSSFFRIYFCSKDYASASASKAANSSFPATIIDWK